ncbi:MAG TPA: hypothetical protein VLV76_02100 [Candidatus Acidoferrum sp.]|nr:hypothetical protein [Candidatus Acidoferrum sp.]
MSREKKIGWSVLAVVAAVAAATAANHYLVPGNRVSPSIVAIVSALVAAALRDIWRR